MEVKRMNTITLFKANGSWVSRDTDPKVKKLFGTDTIPTSFTDRANAQFVLQRITELNPDKKVRLQA